MGRLHASDAAGDHVLVPVQSFTPGEQVQVHAFGHWYTGIVESVGRSKVAVRYTSGSGVTRVKRVGPALVRKLGGAL